MADPWDPADDTGTGATELFPTTNYKTNGLHTLSSIDTNDWFKIYMTNYYTYFFMSRNNNGGSIAYLYQDQEGTNLMLKFNTTSSFYIDYLPTNSGYYYLKLIRFPAFTNWEGSVLYKYTSEVTDSWDPGDNNTGGATELFPSPNYQTHGPHILNTCDQEDWFKIYMTNNFSYMFKQDTYEYKNMAKINIYSVSTQTNLIKSAYLTHLSWASFIPTNTGYYYIQIYLNTDFEHQQYWKNKIRYKYDKDLLDPWDPADNIAAGAIELFPETNLKSHGPHKINSVDTNDWFKIYMTNGYIYNYYVYSMEGGQETELYSAINNTNLLLGSASGSGRFTFQPNQTGYYFFRIKKRSSHDVWEGNVRYKYNSMKDSQFLDSNNTTISGFAYTDLELGDINNDNNLDIIMIGQGKPNPSANLQSKIYINDGSMNFTEINPGSITGISTGAAELGDIDNDNDLDLIIAGGGLGSPITKIYQNDGNGSFTVINPGTLTPVERSDLILGDIDNDGDLDLILSGRSDSSPISAITKIYKNDGKGVFTEFNPNSLVDVWLSSLALGDIDNDNDLDLIISGRTGQFTTIAKIYENDGIGNFTEINQGSIYNINGPISLGDLDNDGDLDLILSGYGNSTSGTIVYKNDGNGNFTEVNNISEYYNILDNIALGDIDNDGDLDLFVSTILNWPIISLALNDGTGNFSILSNTYFMGMEEAATALGDLDNDGDLDLIHSGAIRSFPTLGITKIYINQTATMNSPPDIPSNLENINTGSNWSFKWNAPLDDHTDKNMLRYQIVIRTNLSGTNSYYSKSIQFPKGQANLGNVCVATGISFHSKIPVGKTVFWKVCAIDSAFKASPYSVEQNSIPPPVWHSAIVTSTTQIILTWSDLTNETSYTLYRAIENNTTSAVKIGNLTINITNYIDNSLSPSTKYYYWIRGFSNSFSTGYSEVISNITKPIPPVFYNSLTGNTNILLRWNNIENETSYTLFRNAVNNTNGLTNIAGLLTDQTNYNDTGLSTNTTYYYWLKVYNINGESGYSTIISNTTKSVDNNPFTGGIVKIGPTTIFGDEKLYFANVTRDTKLHIYDIKGRLLWQADVIDNSKCILQGKYFYIKPQITNSLVDGLYIMIFKNNKEKPQIRKFNRITRKRK